MAPRLAAPNLDRYVVSESGCWVWQGATTNGGYGSVHVPGSPSRGRAHRLMYERMVGPIPDGEELDHLCENPPCINPEHLDPVTRREHCRRTHQRLGKDHLHLAAVQLYQQGYKLREIADALGWTNNASAHSAVRYAVQKGLVSADEIPRRVNTTEADRERMRELVASGLKQTQVAAIYGLHSSQVSRIVRGLNNGHKRVTESQR